MYVSDNIACVGVLFQHAVSNSKKCVFLYSVEPCRSLGFVFFGLVNRFNLLRRVTELLVHNFLMSGTDTGH